MFLMGPQDKAIFWKKCYMFSDQTGIISPGKFHRIYLKIDIFSYIPTLHFTQLANSIFSRIFTYYEMLAK